ncbi:MAG: gliding motility-associated C-terminal domain-containing protein, partial [Candidatus Saccharibacteria bacterium]|nr:gliding motility-associated C-terminal domain-containing protein [Candidatus Saccharibacteria bacterium]
TYVITWTFDDGNGQSVTATQNVIVDDTVAPTIPVLADLTGQCYATATVPTTTDGCAGTLTGTTTDPLTYSTQGTYVITWTFNDGNGQSVTAMQNVIVDDTVAPVIPTLVDVTGQCSATANVPTTTDVCAGTLTGTTTDPLFYSTQGNYVITWTFNDGNGQSITATQNVIVDDTVAPAIPVLADVTGQCSAETSAPTTDDNCAGTITGTTSDPLTYSTQGTHIITWTFSDGNGQSVTATQNIIVKDSGAPTISAAGANATIACPATPTFTAPTSSDTCGTTTVNEISTITTPGNCEGSYSVTRTWDATDANGNHSATVSQTIIVQDLTGPTTTTAFPPSIDVKCDAIPTKPELVFVDNCSTVATPVYTEKIINQTPTSYSIEREWNVADACGNPSKFVQLVNVSIANTGIVITSSACNADSTPIDLNTLLPADTPTNGVWTNVDNIGILQGSIFYPLDATLGNHIFEYKVTDGSCPLDIKINMNVNFDCKVLGCEAIVVHNAFSPNGDGINEQLVIDGVEDTICYPTGISIEIYNRWGVLVFETSKYDNTNNVFDGYSRGRTTVSQSDGLPTGTYFYIVNYESFDGTGNIQMNK